MQDASALRLKQIGLALKSRVKHQDTIHDASQGSDQADEGGHAPSLGAEAAQYDVAFSPAKRRRLSNVHDETSPGDHDHTAPVMTAQKPPRFISTNKEAAYGQTQSSFLDQGSTLQSIASAKPPFLLPTPTQRPPERQEPVPEAFSPHRRGRKFVPGGMAETLQSWIMEVTHSVQTGMNSSHAIGGGEPSAIPASVRLEVTETWGQENRTNVFWFIKATDIDGFSMRDQSDHRNELNLMLVHTGRSTDPRVSELSRHDMIEIKWPFWDVTIGEISCMVIVDWKIVR